MGTFVKKDKNDSCRTKHKTIGSIYALPRDEFAQFSLVVVYLIHNGTRVNINSLISRLRRVFIELFDKISFNRSHVQCNEMIFL